MSCGVKLVGATSEASKIHFKILNREDRLPVKSAYVDEETGDVVDSEDQIKGCEVAKGDFIEIEPDEIKKLKLTSAHKLEVEEFEIDTRYLEKPVIPPTAPRSKPFPSCVRQWCSTARPRGRDPAFRERNAVDRTS